MTAGGPEKPIASPILTDLGRRVRLLTVAVVVLALILAGVLVFLAGPTVAGGVLPPPPKSTTACTHFPEPGFSYYVFYNLTTGQVVGMEGTGGATPTPTSNNTVVNGYHPGVINITHQSTMVDNMIWWWAAGNFGQIPWHVNLVTGQVLATAQPSPPIPTYLWLDPVIVVGGVGGFITWRLVLRRRRQPPPKEN